VRAGPRVVVAAVGCEVRRDDGAGPAVLAQLRGKAASVELLGPLASPLDLLGAWDGADLAVVVDAVRADGHPGAVHVVELGPEGAPGGSAPPGHRASSHGLGVVEALRLSRVLGTAPERVVLVGVAGRDFGPGIGLSPPVTDAVALAADLVTDTVHAWAGGGRGVDT